MYSPLKSQSQQSSFKDKILEQKSLKLSVILINKFRIKYNVISKTESEIDNLIIQEVQKLLSEGQNSSNALRKLDDKLNSQIKKMRDEQKNQKVIDEAKNKKLDVAKLRVHGSQLVEQSSKSPAFNSNLAALQSLKTPSRVAKSDLNKASSKSQHIKEESGLIEDQADILNISDEKWNQIVQQNLKKFNEEKEKAIQDKFLKNKAVQEEQKKQIEIFRKQKEQQRINEKQTFNTSGIKASNVYYINQDKRIEREASLKNSGKEKALLLKQKHQEIYKSKKEQMRAEAQERQKIIEDLKNEEIKEKEKQLQKKIELRKVIEKDCQEKKIQKQQYQEKVEKKKDFDDQNMLSYVYTIKANKAYDYDKKKEDVIGLIQKNYQLGSADKALSYEQLIFQRDNDKMNKIQEETQLNRQLEKKKKEIEAKLFQDQQILEKKIIKEIQEKQKIEDMAKIEKDLKEHKEKEELHHQMKKDKNKNHLEIVLKQMTEKPKSFPKIGLGINKSPSKAAI